MNSGPGASMASGDSRMKNWGASAAPMKKVAGPT